MAITGKTIAENASPFIIGGLSIGALSLLTKFVSVKWGIIVWIAPISLIISSVFILCFGGKGRQQNKETIRDMLWQSVPGMVLLTLVILVWAFALNHFDYWPAFGIMMAAYVVAATIFFLGFCPTSIPGGKCWNIGNIQSNVVTTPSAGQRAFAHREGIVFRDEKLVEQERLEYAGRHYAKEHAKEEARARLENEAEETNPVLRQAQVEDEYQRLKNVLEAKPK